MAELTSTELSLPTALEKHAVAQRRLKLAIQLVGVAVSFGLFYAGLGWLLDLRKIDQVPGRNIVLWIIVAVLPGWIATRWTYFGRPVRGGIYGFFIPAVLAAVAGYPDRDGGWAVAVSFLLLLASVGSGLVSGWLVSRPAKKYPATSARRASFQAAMFVGRAAVWATVVVAVVTTLGLLWQASVRDFRGVGSEIGLVWTIAAALVVCLTLWAGYIGGVYHLRDTVARLPFWRTWRAVQVMVFVGTLLVGLLIVAARPYFAAQSIRSAGANLTAFQTLEPTPVGYAVHVDTQSGAFDAQSLAGVSHLYADVALTLQSPDIDDESIEHVRDARNVFALGLTSPNLSDRAFDVIDTMTALERLSVVGTKVTGEAFGRLRGSKLKWLEIDGAPLSREGLWAIHNVSQLEHLLLANVHLEEGDLRFVEWLGNLRDLELKNVSLGENALRTLGESHTDRFRIILNGIEPRDLRQLEFCRQITILEVVDKPVTDADLAVLQHVHQLRIVNLSGSHIRGPGLRHLLGLPRLWRVDLSRTQTGDAELLLFANMQRTEIVGGLQATEFGYALLEFERARVRFAEGKMDDVAFQNAEREFHNVVYGAEAVAEDEVWDGDGD